MNEHIISICNEYMLMKTNPEYGILINGPWGCGKTHLINNIIEDLPKGIDNKDVIKISMYGVTSIFDIEEKIFEKTNTVLSGKRFKTITSAISGLSIGSVSFDAKMVAKLFIRDWFKKKKLVIVDDLERSKIPIHDILGYFYNLIIEKNTRVIFIGHDEKIQNDEYDEYKKTKEKVIGRTLTVKPNVVSAISTFLNEDMIFGLSKDNTTKLLEDIMHNLNFINLRAVRLGLINLSTLMKILVQCKNEMFDYHSESYETGEYTLDNYFEDIFTIYMVLFLQYTEGYLIKRDERTEDKDINDGEFILKNKKGYVRQVLVYYNSMHTGIKQYILENEALYEGEKNNEYIKKSNNAAEMLKFFSSKMVPLSTDDENYNLWEDYLFNSRFDLEQIRNILRKEEIHFIPKSRKEKSALLRLLAGMLDMEKDEFQKLYEAMILEFQNGKLMNVGEILHGFSLLVYLEEHGIVKSEQSYEAFFDDIIERYKLLDLNKDDEWMDYDISVSMGYQFYPIADNERWQKFKKKIVDRANDNRERDLRTHFINEFQSIDTDEDWNNWVNHFYNVYRSEPRKYYGRPLLSYIDIHELFGMLITRKYQQQFNIIYALRERYGVKYSNGIFQEVNYPDFDNLVILKELYKNHLTLIKDDDIKKIRASQIAGAFEELVIYCKKFIEIGH